MMNVPYTRAITRDLPLSFSQSLKQDEPSIPIDVALARKQHHHYTQVLRSLIPALVQLPPDEKYPDCCFVEDTAVIVGGLAAITHLGAPTRRGEESQIRDTLIGMGLKTVDIQAPGTVDGGDVLFTGRHILVGLTKRTNQEGVRQLSEVFGSRFPVMPLEVTQSLHLKSIVTAYDSETLIIADTPNGRALAPQLPYECLFVPDPLASNVVVTGSAVLIQAGFPRTEALLRGLSLRKNKEVIPLAMSELAKADGALTCCSLLIS